MAIGDRTKEIADLNFWLGNSRTGSRLSLSSLLASNVSNNSAKK